jgi:hypothetical protein
MIETIVLAVVIACLIGLGCILIGRILKSLAIPIAVQVGGFLEQYAWVIGVLCGLLFFFGGGSFLGLKR